ncbi:Bifunctional uridylyltransferase/uridylyl-removing enzyme [Lacunisphaera limnophila]|uniref:Bifunctional uridylyltransferase/uridylyl-removing enzyme n=1 Tax=Lacunisphaera limnophila TaxID=1838286 RepID=A0A1D8AWR8_9BACT|nr:[protein-PII] uridylyltransferase [Lacunisphaera limnophila]AOS45328.1 Bifunctional uridylyltransferase/uridylyl-removing enzyme [Lacunisphaera limnophila]
MSVPTATSNRHQPVFTADTPAPARLAACKAYLDEEGARIRLQHQDGAPGLRIAAALSDRMDGLLVPLFTTAVAAWRQQHGEPPVPVCLVALGGYGRGELNPLSDVDVMFLYPEAPKTPELAKFQEHLSNGILYPLWDLKLKIGHSTRTLSEVFVEAAREIKSKTALLEARFLAGTTTLYDNFTDAYRKHYLQSDPKAYIVARLGDQSSRRAQHGGTVFLQEPDIKNGVGGLRDYQNTLWMARVRLGITRLDELAQQNYLQVSELRAMQEAYDFLMRVRNELHYMSKHPTDVLNLEIQPRLAASLGYPQIGLLERVEAFMHDYYRHAQAIYRISQTVEQRLALTVAAAPGLVGSLKNLMLARRNERTKRIDGFVIRGRELAYEHRDIFQQDPVRLIRVFRHCQQLGCTPDLDLAALIRASVPLITQQVIASADANLSFQTILEEAGQVYPTLSLMHELGVLGRFVPEFAPLTCLVQHEYYHRYTADIHTLSTIRELDRIFTAADPRAEKYREVLHATASPTLLYLILLLHDIGKSEGIQGHAEAGVTVAGPVLDRLGVAPDTRATVNFIIKNHLIMARFWQKHDLDDPSSSAAFAELVGDADLLRFLYVHTYCDANGTSASLWNSYKDSLHRRLFDTTLERLVLGDKVESRLSERKEMIRRNLIAQTIPGISPDEITAHFNLLPERYFIQTDEPEITLHIQMVNRLLQSISNADSLNPLRPVIEWKDDLNRSYTTVHVVTWDRAGLFYKLAGAFSVAGLSILSARITTRADHIAIDTFHIVEPGRGLVQNQKSMETFARTVDDALVSDKDLLPDINAQAARLANANRYKAVPSELPATFPPTVEVYHELSLKRIIVEIQAHDRIGLLYQLVKTISDHGFDITFARINTERSIALDTFYIEPRGSDTPVEESHLHVLRDTLRAVITPAKAEAPA